MNIDLPHIHLFGNSEENFYSLGKRDKVAFELMNKQLAAMCARNNIMARLLKATTELSRNFVKNNQTTNLKDLKAYSEGLEVTLDEVLFAFILPEMVSSFNKFTPQLLGIIPGCSSLFMWDKAHNGVVHSRILDYAMSGVFEKNERSILYEFTNRRKVYSFGSAGLPLPSLSGINEDGLTAALHYKHNDRFNLAGESIFFIMEEVLSKSTNIREAIRLLKTKNSMSLWGLYISDKNGEVAAIDICGKDIHVEKYQLQEHQYLYFNNLPIVRKAQNLQPFGNKDQCIMRAEVIKERMKKLQDSSSSKDILKASLKVLGKENLSKKANSKNWKLSPITPSSIQLYSFHSSKNKAYFVPGANAKFFNDTFIEINNLFSNPQKKIHESTKEISKYQKGMHKLTLYQMAMDKGDLAVAYHEIQMAIKLLQGTTEEQIANFFFFVTQYICEKDKRDLGYLYQDLIEIERKLPMYLEDQRMLFLMRLEKILGYNVVNRASEFKNENLKKIFLQEYPKNALAIKGLKHLIFPRIDVLDIIYAY